MISKPLTENFISRQPLKSCQEVLFGCETGWMGWRSCVSFAISKITGNRTPSLSLIELSSLTKENAWRASELLRDLIKSEPPQSENEIKIKWLYILLSWLYENRKTIKDPFREVEVVYADFNHPAEIEGFVGFMPPSDGWRPGEHSQAENHDRMLRLWHEYLEKKRLLYSDESFTGPQANP